MSQLDRYLSSSSSGPVDGQGVQRRLPAFLLLFFLKDLCRRRTRAERTLGTPVQDSCVNKAFLASDGPQ